MNRRDAIKAAVGAGVAAVLPVRYPASVASEATFVAVVLRTKSLVGKIYVTQELLDDACVRRAIQQAIVATKHA